MIMMLAIKEFEKGNLVDIFPILIHMDSLFTANDQNRQTFDQLSARNQVQEYINQIAFSNSLIANIMIIPKNPEHLTFSTLSSTSVSIDYEAPWFQEASSSQDNLWLHTRIGGYSNAQQPAVRACRLDEDES